MSVVLQTGVMKYRENENDSWHPLIIKAETDLTMLIDEYDATATKTWAKGELCLHDGFVYSCKNGISTPKTWTASDWQQTTVGEDLKDVRNSLNQVEDAIAYVQSGDTASRNYTAGQFVYLKNHATLPEGLYTVNQNTTIAQGTSVTGKLTANADGMGNSIKSLLVSKFWYSFPGYDQNNGWISDIYGLPPSTNPFTLYLGFDNSLPSDQAPFYMYKRDDGTVAASKSITAGHLVMLMGVSS